MNTYYIRVTTGRSRVVRVEAKSRHVAEAAAVDLMERDFAHFPLEHGDVNPEDAAATGWGYHDDSIIANTKADGSYSSYDYAPDDPVRLAP